VITGLGARLEQPGARQAAAMTMSVAAPKRYRIRIHLDGCHSEERSDEESCPDIPGMLIAGGLRDAARSFAKFILSEANGLRMTTKGKRLPK